MPNRVPGDDRRSAWFRPPDVVAAETNILTLSDALLTWMQQEPINIADVPRVLAFFTSEGANPFGAPLADPGGTTKRWFLERMDPDANRLFAELLRTAWHLRKLKERYELR